MNPLLGILFAIFVLVILLATYVGWRAYRLHVVIRKLKKPLAKFGREMEEQLEEERKSGDG